MIKILNLYNDIFLEILKFLPSIDIKNFTETCKILQNISYLEKLTLNINDNPYLFAKKFSSHNLTLKNIITYMPLLNIQHFMPSKWPESVTIFNSKITDTLSPNAEKTKHLKIHSMYHLRKPLKINWKKFKNLKSLYIYYDDIILDGIDECTSLTNIFIFLIKKKVLNYKVASLKKLKILITNCDVQKDTTFMSKELEFLITNNMDNANFKFLSSIN